MCNGVYLHVSVWGYQILRNWSLRQWWAPMWCWKLKRVLRKTDALNWWTVSLTLSLFILEEQYCCVARGGLELTILSQSPEIYRLALAMFSPSNTSCLWREASLFIFMCVFARGRQWVSPILHLSFFETRSLTELGAHGFNKISCQQTPEVLMCLPSSRCRCVHCALLYLWVLGTQTHFLVIVSTLSIEVSP